MVLDFFAKKLCTKWLSPVLFHLVPIGWLSHYVSLLFVFVSRETLHLVHSLFLKNILHNSLYFHLVYSLSDDVIFNFDLFSRINALLTYLLTYYFRIKFCFVYSILMNIKWHKLSLMQRINTVSMIKGGGSKKVYIFSCFFFVFINYQPKYTLFCCNLNS